ncbi:TPA: hypothetical protein ACQNYY_001484 [Streptococcus pyogenes]|uniref:hypothetical protein n=1 Tax=Streptococcus pyogenes TaxID=1314 RepID=UPI001370344A|nr:hypothetical protein [Streptococcus pyogenes]MZX74063.1 hypothetical protein [Streptococcus pyogenes]MZX82504.1 hypothetical protein [Streptococcus pyogenes]UEN80701.1 hypothetical protein H7797_01880 [Streptococcus pyogenes]HEQ0375941.1 hypothetical protein [Streptococcus pyogenes]HEQ0994700.1 hypothetical protein [Streptococcus pyogenes]
MKTEDRRQKTEDRRQKNILLKLTTFYLAVFGVVLTIGRPVLAEMNLSEDSRRSQLVTDSEREQLDRAHQMGEEAGYNDGKSGKPKKDRLLEKVPSGVNESESSDYWDSYESSYSDGYREWTDEHPVEAALSWIWEMITSWVQGIF